MPIAHPIRRRSTFGIALALLAGSLAAATAPATERAAIAIIATSTWSPNDPARDGAQEFAVLLRLAALQQQNALAGLVGVADRRGSFQAGEERAFRFAALNGVPVMKVSASGNIVHCPDDLFIEAGALPATEACQLLAEALEHQGAPPRAQNPMAPTPEEMAAITRHVQRLGEAIALGRGSRLTQN